VLASRAAENVFWAARYIERAEDTARIVERDLADGQHRNETGAAELFTTAFFHEPGELNERLARLGWKAGIARTARYFIHGPARPV